MSAATLPDLSAPLVPSGSVRVPTTGTNDWWHVCDVNVVEGSTTNITWINELVPTPPGASLTNGVDVILRGGRSPGRLPAPHRPRSVNNATYVWDFGDGSGVTNVFEPLHSYANPGWYTVSLQITENSGTPPKSDTVIKTNYIYVVDVPPTVAITNPSRMPSSAPAFPSLFNPTPAASTTRSVTWITTW